MKMVAASKMTNGGDFGYKLANNWFEADEIARRYLPEYGRERGPLVGNL